jgi:small subunit ribosomal protein S6
MRDYELVAIISPELDEDGVSEIIDKVSQSIDSRGGVVEGVDKWGVRKLAYPIKKFMEANYVLARFKLMPKSVKELEAEISALGSVLRFLVVNVKD